MALPLAISFVFDAALLVQWLCLGVLFAMGTYYLALFGAVQDRCFLYFSGYALSMGIHFTATANNGPVIAAPTEWNPLSVVFLLTATVAAVCYPLFIRQFLLPARLPSRLNRAFSWLAGGHGIAPVVALVGGWTVWSGWVALLTAPVVVVTLLAMGLAWRRGFRPAGWLLLATAVTGVSSLAYVAPILHLPVTLPAEAIVQVGAAIQALILGLAVVWRLRDIRSQSHRAEEARQKAEGMRREAESMNAALRETLRMKSNLLGFAAHDLRTPLSGIIGFADLAREETQEETTREYTGHIVTSANRLQRLVDDLLITAELDTEGVRARTEPTDLGQFVEDAVRPFTPLAGIKNQQLAVRVAPGLSARLDRDRFQEVIDNLVSNAIKYTPRGGEIAVEVTGDSEGPRLVVSDSGPGFTEADRAAMFKPFQRLSARPTGGEPSTGLGLAIVKQIVDLHEGRVWVESEPGAGSRFTVALPPTREAATREVVSA